MWDVTVFNSRHGIVHLLRDAMLARDARYAAAIVRHPLHRDGHVLLEADGRDGAARRCADACDDILRDLDDLGVEPREVRTEVRASLSALTPVADTSSSCRATCAPAGAADRTTAAPPAA